MQIQARIPGRHSTLGPRWIPDQRSIHRRSSHPGWSRRRSRQSQKRLTHRRQTPRPQNQNQMSPNALIRNRTSLQNQTNPSVLIRSLKTRNDQNQSPTHAVPSVLVSAP